jgi:hypothetical protein
VTKLVNEEKDTGYYSVEWNAASLASGIYFYEIRTDKFSAVKKLVLMK